MGVRGVKDGGESGKRSVESTSLRRGSGHRRDRQSGILNFRCISQR